MAGETGGTTDRLLNKLQYALANKAVTIGTAATGDLFPIADISDDYKIKYAVGTDVLVAAGVTATPAEINARSAGASRLVNVTDAATYTVLAANSGKIHIMPDFTSSCTLTLPAVAAGLEYTFIGKAVAADAQNWIIKSPSATNYFIGGVSFADTDAGAGADEIHAGVWSNGSTNDFLTVVTPGAGTYIYVICDGTNWIVNGQVASATVPAFSDT
jgi:hypothetical protein